MNKTNRISENEPEEFSFGDSSVAHGYDSRLVPILFVPWADRLVEENQPWEGKRVLDLATGTGVVAQRLSPQVGPKGQVIAIDINAEMLELAKNRCAGLMPAVNYIECSAHHLDVASDSVNVVVCQQGFQFFPDRRAAAQEIFRVLCDGGQAVITTWCPVVECQFFGAICEALILIGEPEVSDKMGVPFNLMPESELVAHFESGGFINVRVERQELDLVLDGGIGHAIEAAYSTPIGPKLKELTDERQDEFRKTFTDLLTKLSTDGTTMGRMVSNVLSAEKPNGRS
jgi:SAM-dependent methyltransferase